MCVIWHPKKGWFCTDDFGGFGFSESLPDILYWFDSIESAQIYFTKDTERFILEIYYPREKRGEKLFTAPT